MQQKPVILVTGKSGQLGSELLSIQISYPAFQWVFLDRKDLDLCHTVVVQEVFERYDPAFFINCAAYTAVDKAEEEQKEAATVNTDAVGIIAAACSQYNTELVHISTDYVFDGRGTEPYLPEDETEPINYYGQTKRLGEEKALDANKKTIIIRTSWVYSSYGKNFVKTMLRLMNEKSSISVVNDQIGAPTYARDLAVAIMDIITASVKHYGVYHFSNEGVITWFDFAKAIREITGLHCDIKPISTEGFPTPAARPKYAVLDKTSMKKDYGIIPRMWRDALTECLQQMERIAK